jgi:hypothetical protein
MLAFRLLKRQLQKRRPTQVQVVRKEIYLLVEASINLQFPRAWQANHL